MGRASPVAIQPSMAQALPVATKKHNNIKHAINRKLSI